MKSVLMSIQPKWCELIASGKKTIEVRKTRPKIETPFKCYIYETNWKDNTYWKNKHNGKLGKVIGEFVCDRTICSQAYYDNRGFNHLTNVLPEDIRRTCLSEYDLWDYIGGKASKANEMFTGWLWHISALKIYNKPKELGEFTKAYPIKCGKGYESIDCTGCGSEFTCSKRFIRRPPQSWQFVEELEVKL